MYARLFGSAASHVSSDDLLTARASIVVNRCQLEMQRSVGTPAQTEELLELRKQVTNIDLRVQALDKRFDVLHMVRVLS